MRHGGFQKPLMYSLLDASKHKYLVYFLKYSYSLEKNYKLFESESINHYREDLSVLTMICQWMHPQYSKQIIDLYLDITAKAKVNLGLKNCQNAMQQCEKRASNNKDTAHLYMYCKDKIQSYVDATFMMNK